MQQHTPQTPMMNPTLHKDLDLVRHLLVNAEETADEHFTPYLT